MDRGAASGFLTEIAKSRNQPIHFVEVAFDAPDGGSIYLTDAYRSVTWAGNTYTGNGHFLGFNGLGETFDMTIPTVKVSLSAVDQSWISIALTKQYMDRPVRIYKAFLDSAMAVITSPILIFEGRIDSLDISDDPSNGACGLSISASSQWIDFTKKPGRHTNTTEQQVFYPGDLGFDYASQKNADLKWGIA